MISGLPEMGIYVRRIAQNAPRRMFFEARIAINR